MTSTPDLLAGRVALVTGATRGIGRAIAIALAQSGADVWVHGRDQAALSALVAEVSASGIGRARPVAFDLADPKAIRSCFGEVQKESKRLDILVNNAGVLKASTIEMAGPDMMDETFAVNLRGLLIACGYASRLMQRAGGGSIINLTSIMGRFGYAGQSVYAASKAGVIGATQSLAKELAPRRIRVNAVAPGMIETDLIAGLSGDKRAQAASSIGLGRIGKPEDVAPLCVFLASDASAYMTGQVIGVDGGMAV